MTQEANEKGQSKVPFLEDALDSLDEPQTKSSPSSSVLMDDGLDLPDIEQGGEGGLVGGVAVVVGQEDPLRAHGECVQHPQGETARAAEVGPRGEPRRRQRTGLDRVTRGQVRPVVDDDQVRQRVGLLRHRRERVDEQLGPVPRDDDADDRAGRERSGHDGVRPL